MKIYPKIFIIFFLLLTKGIFNPILTSTPDDPPRTNIELFNDIFYTLSSSIVTHVSPDYPLHFTIYFGGYDWFVRNRLINLIQNEGYTVGVGNENDELSVVVEIGVEELGVKYSRVYRDSIFGKRKIEREVRGAFSVNITNLQIPVVYRIEDSVLDNVPIQYINEIESPALPFTQSSVPETAFLDRIVGPAVIISATAVVIYLLFSVRS